MDVTLSKVFKAEIFYRDGNWYIDLKNVSKGLAADLSTHNQVSLDVKIDKDKSIRFGNVILKFEKPDDTLTS